MMSSDRGLASRFQEVVESGQPGRSATREEAVLVTGVAGFIGSHLAERLLSLGYRLVGIDNFDDFYSPTLKRRNIQGLAGDPRFLLVDGDIRDRALLDSLFSEIKIGTIAHLSGRAGVRPSLDLPLLYEDVNIRGTINLLEVGRASGVKQFLFASSSSVYGPNGKGAFKEEAVDLAPASPYAASKASAELFCRTYAYLYNIPVVVLRLFTVYGPRQRPEMAIHRFVSMLDRGEEIAIFGDGTTSRDYTYVADIVAGFEAALGYRGQFGVFNLGSGNSVNLMYLLRLIEEALGKKAKVRYQKPAPGDVPATLADVSRARAILGYEPKTVIEEGIPRFVRWYLQERRTT